MQKLQILFIIFILVGFKLIEDANFSAKIGRVILYFVMQYAPLEFLLNVSGLITSEYYLQSDMWGLHSAHVSDKKMIFLLLNATLSLPAIFSLANPTELCRDKKKEKKDRVVSSLPNQTCQKLARSSGG